MEVSAVERNALSPIDVTLAGIVMEVSAVALRNASDRIDVTPGGITTAPKHEDPLETAPLAIAKFGVELDGAPVMQS
jgi:hypothetical protein